MNLQWNLGSVKKVVGNAISDIFKKVSFTGIVKNTLQKLLQPIRK
jgi:hypothetical protein